MRRHDRVYLGLLASAVCLSWIMTEQAMKWVMGW